MAEVDLVWMDPPGCYQCVQMPRLCVWPVVVVRTQESLFRVTFEGFDEVDEQVVRASEISNYVAWCWEQAIKET